MNKRFLTSTHLPYKHQRITASYSIRTRRFPAVRLETPWTRLLISHPRQSLPSTVRSQSTLSLADHREEMKDLDEISTTEMKPFLLADIGEGIANVEVLQWFVQPGDDVVQFDKICEVQSDKATVEITSRFDGTVGKLCGNVGDMINVGDPLIYFVTGDTELNYCDRTLENSTANDKLNNLDEGVYRTQIPTQNAPVIKLSENVTSSHIPKKVLATPAVRRLSLENGIELGTIQGSGPKGIILKADVLNAINMNHSAQSKPQVQSHAADTTKNIVEHESKVVSIRGHHRLMVKSMTETLQVPHMCYSDEVDMTALKKYRNELQKVARDHGIEKLSYLPFAIKAVSLSIDDFPIINSSLNAEEMTLTYHSQHDIGVAIDSPRGLIVPVIRNCQNLTIWEIAMELNKIRKLAHEGHLEEHHLTGPTFTLSNIGSIGGTYMSPVVLPPQVAIGAMGKIQRLPRFVNEDSLEVEEVHLMSMSWGGDHRVIDGATLGRFSNRFKSYMEQPLLFMIK